MPAWFNRVWTLLTFNQSALIFLRAKVKKLAWALILLLCISSFAVTGSCIIKGCHRKWWINSGWPGVCCLLRQLSNTQAVPALHPCWWQVGAAGCGLPPWLAVCLYTGAQIVHMLKYAVFCHAVCVCVHVCCAMCVCVGETCNPMCRGWYKIH